MKRRLYFRVLGLSFLGLVLLTILFWLEHRATEWLIVGLLFWLSWGLATIVLIGLFVLPTLILRTKKAPHLSPEVLAALTSTLQGDLDPRVRSKAAMGLAELDLEESSHHHKHDELDNILISALKDEDPLVRSKAAVGLAELEFEEASYRHEHSKLEEVLFEEGP